MFADRGPIARTVAVAVLVAMGLLLLGVMVGSRVGRTGTPGDGSAEAGFLRDMATHHRQAVAMAMTMLQRTEDADIRYLALDIATSQGTQVGTMTGWLEAWDLPLTGEGGPMAWMGDEVEGRMPGMANDERLRELETLPSARADVLFLELMRIHHLAGVDMARAILDRGDNALVRELAEAIAATQSNEIALMDAMLAERGATADSPLPGGTPVAVPATPTDDHS